MYNQYASTRQCENTCERFVVNSMHCPRANSLVLTWGPRCDCKEGYARLPNGKCVDLNDERCYDLHKPSRGWCTLFGSLFFLMNLK